MTIEEDSLEVSLNIDAAAIPQDSYEAYAVLRAPYMHTARTAIAISRSEDTFWIPLGIGAAAGFVGFGWLALTKW